MDTGYEDQIIQLPLSNFLWPISRYAWLMSVFEYNIKSTPIWRGFVWEKLYVGNSLSHQPSLKLQGGYEKGLSGHEYAQKHEWPCITSKRCLHCDWDLYLIRIRSWETSLLDRKQGLWWNGLLTYGLTREYSLLLLWSQRYYLCLTSEFNCQKSLRWLSIHKDKLH